MKSTSMQKANKIFFIVSKSILFILLMYKLNYLYTYRNFKDNKNLIEYTLLKSTKYSGGKGNHYSMDILYNDKSHQLTLTSKEYQNLNRKDLPDVYFYQYELLTDWSYEQHKRYLYVLIILFLLISITNRYYYKTIQRK